MSRVLFQIYGPIAIYSYGAAIAVGALLFIWLVRKDSRFKALMLENTFSDIFVFGTVSALVGGRALYVMRSYDMFEHWTEWFAIWEPGFSVLGAIIAVLLFVPWYLKKLSVPVLPFFDLIATYTGVLQGVSRLGCFFAGCCFGCETIVPWAVQYTDSDTMAPLYVYLHPSQVYSVFALLSIAVFMYFVGRKYLRIAGQQIACYLILASMQRFIVDFFRGDREFMTHKLFSVFSLHQYVALGIAACAAVIFILVTCTGRQHTS